MSESYRDDVEQYLSENPDAEPHEIADSVGCSRKTAGKWRRRLRDSEGSEQGSESGSEGSEGSGEQADLTEADLDGDGDGDDLDGDGGDDPAEADPDDDPAKDYHCADCGEPLDYLEKECPGCGAEPAWAEVEA